MNDAPDDGMRFSQVYLRRGEPAADSHRMRRRIAAVIFDFDKFLDGLALAVKREQGVVVDYAYMGYDWAGFLEHAELRDVLDLVSTAANLLRKYSAKLTEWVTTIGRVFTEENLPYRVNAHGGVRYAIDDEFDSSRAATIAALAGARYQAALNNFDAAHKALSSTPPRGKDAVRSTFAAVEGLFRLMFASAPRLGAEEITQHLTPVVTARFSGDPTARNAGTKLLRSFREWVDSAHFYRHEPGHAEPQEPPLEISILLVSGGAAWLRWLAEIDRNAAADCSK